jgi:hypothetical protein
LNEDNRRRQSEVDRTGNDPGRSEMMDDINDALIGHYELSVLWTKHFPIETPLIIRHPETDRDTIFYSRSVPDGQLYSDVNDLGTALPPIFPRGPNAGHLTTNPLLVSFAAAIRARRFKRSLEQIRTPAHRPRHTLHVQEILDYVITVDEAIKFEPKRPGTRFCNALPIHSQADEAQIEMTTPGAQSQLRIPGPSQESKAPMKGSPSRGSETYIEDSPQTSSWSFTVSNPFSEQDLEPTAITITDSKTLHRWAVAYMDSMIDVW